MVVRVSAVNKEWEVYRVHLVDTVVVVCCKVKTLLLQQDLACHILSIVYHQLVIQFHIVHKRSSYQQVVRFYDRKEDNQLDIQGIVIPLVAVEGEGNQHQFRIVFRWGQLLQNQLG